MCCAIAVSMLQLPQLLSVPEQLDRTPAQCIRTGDWLSAGLQVPPFDVMSLGWRGALRYIRQLDGSVPQLPLPPDVHDLPYEQRKHVILYSSTIPSVINLGQWVSGVLKQTMQQQNFVALSRFELQQLVRQLGKHHHHVVHLNLNHNNISSGEAPEALCRSLSALTGLQMLDLSGIALRNCAAKTSLRVVFVSIELQGTIFTTLLVSSANRWLRLLDCRRSIFQVMSGTFRFDFGFILSDLMRNSMKS